MTTDAAPTFISPAARDAAEALLTVRDFLRYAVTRFQRADLHFGHGARDAIDEAAFLVLETLSLPIDDINPWLEARLTAAERTLLAARIEARVTTREPAAYLVNRAYMLGASFYVDRRVLVPRSFIGELLGAELTGPDGESLIPDPMSVRRVLELCTGSGCLAILAARAFPYAYIDAVDISADALAVARRNVDDYDLASRIALFEGDLYAPVAGRRYDLVIANPPYVDAASMAALPPEYQAEPALALAGGQDGLDIVRRLIDGAANALAPGGGLICEIGAGRDALEASYPGLPFFWVDTEESDGETFWIDAADLGVDAR